MIVTAVFPASYEIQSGDNSTVPEGIIDATKVPLERRVVFEGSKRVVSFPGSIHKVEF